MSMTYLEVIYRTVAQAQRGSQMAQFANIDTQSICEAMMPSIFQQAGEAAAGNERKRSLLKRDKTITVTNGAATIPDDALTAYLEDSTFYDPSDLSKTYSWIRNWNDFINPSLANQPFVNYGYYSVSGGVTLGQREPGEVWSPSSGFTGSMTLNIPCVPVIPATATTTLAVVDEVLNDIIDIGAAALRGEVIRQAALIT